MKMINQLKIKVTCADSHRAGEFQTLYQNTLNVDDSMIFDYQKVIDVLTLLYKKKSPIIEFKLFTAYV